MTKREAWEYLAECWRHTRLNGTCREVLYPIGNDAAAGLCRGIELLRLHDHITAATTDQMLDVIARLPNHILGYKWGWTEKAAERRVAFCCEQAAKEIGVAE